MLAVVFIVLGGVILASNLGLFTPEAQRAVEVIWPAAVILAGLGLILAGGQVGTSQSAPFTVERAADAAAAEAAVEEADLFVSAGLGDLHIGAAGLRTRP